MFFNRNLQHAENRSNKGKGACIFFLLDGIVGTIIGNDAQTFKIKKVNHEKTTHCRCFVNVCGRNTSI